MNTQEIISKISDGETRHLLDRISVNDSSIKEGEQVKALLKMRMVASLIESLDKNSASSDKLARMLNWLTLVIAFAACAGVFVTIIQLCK